MIHNEEKLLQRIRSGDDEAFALLMEQYADQVYALVVRIIQQREDAEELTQDVFIMESFSGRSTFATWLYRIAYNCAISHTRRHRVSHLSIDEGRIAAIRDEDIEQMSEQFMDIMSLGEDGEDLDDAELNDETFDIGDVVGAVEFTTGIQASSEIAKKIVKIKDNTTTISYKVGE